MLTNNCWKSNNWPTHPPTHCCYCLTSHDRSWHDMLWPLPLSCAVMQASILSRTLWVHGVPLCSPPSACLRLCPFPGNTLLLFGFNIACFLISCIINSALQKCCLYLTCWPSEPPHILLCIKFWGLLDVNLIFRMLLLVIWFAVSDFSND